jgi:hypothetical protein
MTKTTHRVDTVKGVMIITIALLLLALITLIVTYPRTANVPKSASAPEGVFVSLGAMEYDFSSGKAVKVTDEKIVALRDFLTEQGKKDIGDVCPEVYYNVAATTEDKQQVLLDYGCTHPSAHMYVVYENNTWKMLSPTNNFSTLPVATCQHVNENNISPTLAPVCMNSTDDPSVSSIYTIRQ